MVPRIRYKLTSSSGEPIAEPAEKVDPLTDCGHDWTQLTSKPVRRLQALITGCLFLGGTGLLTIVRFLPWSDPTARTVIFVFWLVWGVLTGIGFLASLVLWLATEPALSLSRSCLRSQEPIALRWQLPGRLEKRAIKIELCGQEEWTHVVRGDTQVELYRFLTLALADLSEEFEHPDGTIYFRPPALKPSFNEQGKKGAHGVRYWINVRTTRGVLSTFEYGITVRD